MSWKGWVVSILAVILIFYLMLTSGMFMHGDCIDLHDAPPCER